MARSPYMNQMIREWAIRNSDIVAPPQRVITNEVYNAWIKAHPQKPFVVSSFITPDERRVISILCTQCADIHTAIVPISILSAGDKEIQAQCDEKYRTGNTYKYVDWGIGNKFTDKRVPV